MASPHDLVAGLHVKARPRPEGVRPGSQTGAEGRLRWVFDLAELISTRRLSVLRKTESCFELFGRHGAHDRHRLLAWTEEGDGR
jgi:hypothetical protein